MIGIGLRRGYGARSISPPPIATTTSFSLHLSSLEHTTYLQNPEGDQLTGATCAQLSVRGSGHIPQQGVLWELLQTPL